MWYACIEVVVCVPSIVRSVMLLVFGIILEVLCLWQHLYDGMIEWGGHCGGGC